jgi:hypothetical protein
MRYTETPPPLQERPLEDRLVEVRRALPRLQQRIATACPGEHRYVPHGDGKPPMCPSCGYTDVGLHSSELGAGEAAYRRRALHGDDVDDDVDVYEYELTAR